MVVKNEEKSYAQIEQDLDSTVNKVLGFKLMRVLEPAGYVCFVIMLVMLALFWNDEWYRNGIIGIFAFLFVICTVGNIFRYLGKMKDRHRG